jgi:hypothetical protein
MIDQLEDVEHRSTQSPQPVSNQDVVKQEKAKLSQYIKEKPAQSVLIGLGVGIGTGLILGTIFRGSSKYLSHDEVLTEKIGNHVKNSLREIAPASLMKHFRS